jgi:hypothetical protein
LLHTVQNQQNAGNEKEPEVNDFEGFDGATRWDRTGDLLITNFHLYP